MFKKPYYFDAFKILPLNLARLLLHTQFQLLFLFFSKMIDTILTYKKSFGGIHNLREPFFDPYPLVNPLGLFVKYLSVFGPRGLLCYLLDPLPIIGPYSLWMTPFMISSVHLLPAIYRNSIFSREQNPT